MNQYSVSITLPGCPFPERSQAFASKKSYTSSAKDQAILSHYPR
jgi:hypothetical protein